MQPTAEQCSTPITFPFLEQLFVCTRGNDCHLFLYVTNVIPKLLSSYTHLLLIV